MNYEQQIGEEAFALHQEILEMEKASRAVTLKIMEALIQMQESKGFKAVLGDQEAEWSAYLADVGVFYSRSRVRRWKRIFDLCNLFDLNKEMIFMTPESRLEQVALLTPKILNTEKKVKEALSYAAILLPRDWKNELAKYRGLPTPDDCKHSFKEYEVCTDCGEKHLKQNEE